MDAVVVATADPFHHGIGYGDPPERSLAPEKGGLDEARRRIGEGLALLAADGLVTVAAPRSRLALFGSQFVSLPVVLLGASAGVAIMTGGLLDAMAIAAVKRSSMR